ncbi:hypothetical protein ISCGN_016640 [Ixodes scapularis]
MMKMEDAAGHCEVCQQKATQKKLRAQGSFFMMLDMEKQVKFLIRKTKDALGENLLRAAASPDDPITDITTGKGYRNMREEAKLAVDDLTLTINTDGSPVFESSKTSVWPIQFVINELPPHVRFKHQTLAGLWFGKTHPNMQTFMGTFVEAVNSMQPVKWKHGSHLHQSKAFVLCCSVDAPSRAAVQNMVLFNGYHGCPWCLMTGEYREGSMRYIADEPPALRSSAMVFRDMQLALAFKDSVNGIKGPSAMMNLPVPAERSVNEDMMSDSASDRDFIETSDDECSAASDFDEEPPDFQPGPVFEDILSSCFEQFGAEKLPNTETTKAGAIAMVMSFIAGNGLTWTALGQCVCMINTIFGKDVLPQTKYVFRKLWAGKTKDLVNYHYLCPSCEGMMKMEGAAGHCEVCQQKATQKKLRAQGSFFMMLDMEKQVKFLIGKTKDALGENLLRPAASPDDPITDITTGKGYRNMREEAKLAVDDLTLTINTDGSPVFESSKTSVWPIQFVINELPPHVRFKHPTLAGLWFGKTHPNMQTFIGTFVEAVNSMQPVKWKHGSHLHQSKAFVLCCSVDAPARAAVQNMVLFNGYHGCPWCLMTGEYREGSMRYIADEPPALRSSAMVSRDMQLALAFKDSVNGIKGPSAMMNLPGFDLVTGYSVEYMHCVLQGVARQVAELLFSSSNSNQHFYIGTAATLARVNARLLCIKPPHCITRLPRSLCERSYWKASEWRHWLLFYMLPCLQGILPVDYRKLLAKLCEAVHILLRDSIALHEIQQAELLPETFVGRSKTLFGVTSAKFNLHQLLHLCNCVRHLGPL